MITIGFCTKKDNPKHIEHIKKMFSHPKIEIIQIINTGDRSLTECYNEILDKSSNNLICYMHDDVILETKSLASKLCKIFEKNPEYCIIGVAGSKELPITGRWWDNRKSMYGIVKHSDNGKTWTSEYSPNLNGGICDVVIVDGLFFVVDKSKLKVRFNEDVKGFHFYDVDFTFNNHINGVKIGVTTDIKLTHLSIGQTNSEWESNRVNFVETYKDKLPRVIKEDFKYKKLKVLLGCLNFQNLTGSEVYTYELAKGLINKNIDVSIISNNVNGVFTNECKKLGIKLHTFKEPPMYKLGDGEWGINTPNGIHKSQQGVLYRLSNDTFDVINCYHTPIVNELIKLYPESTFINTIHSEIIDLEIPVIDEKIKKYIAIRPSIKEFLIDKYDIKPDNIEVIYNFFDKKRFNKLKNNDKGNVTLFVGTMDYLRKDSIIDLVGRCEGKGNELWLVGEDRNGYARNLSETYEHVKYFSTTNNIEDFYNKCSETAGIMLGRTTIEGFLCGKPGMIYTVDKNGEILNIENLDVPENLDIFDNDFNIDKLIDIYNKVLS